MRPALSRIQNNSWITINHPGRHVALQVPNRVKRVVRASPDSFIVQLEHVIWGCI